jgi:hypothetical protein
LAPGENADDLAADVLNVTFAGLQSGVRLQSTGHGDCRLEEAAEVAVLAVHREESR